MFYEYGLFSKMGTEKTGRKQETEQHVVRLSHVPYGFFEKEVYGYYSQFGKVKRVRVCRNKKGHHTGIVFVEFGNGEVAQIAAQTMDNYLLGENRLRCRVLRQEEVPKTIRWGRLFGKITKPGGNRLRHAKEHFKEKTPGQEFKQRERFVDNLRERMEKIEKLGIKYQFNFDAKLREFLQRKNAVDEEETTDIRMEEEVESKKQCGKEEYLETKNGDL